MSLAALVLLGPLLAILALVVGVTSVGPILFRHRRIGRDGRQFDMLKFRTMHVDYGGPGVTKRGDPRVTPIGRILRKAKLDELPELWNVVRGDMSLVGPRPEAAEYVDLSELAWREILRVRPGITDPVTLRLRNEEELLAAVGDDYESFYRVYLLPYKLRGYAEYLSTRTWKQDLAVLCQTLVGIVLPCRTPAPSPDDIVSSADGVARC